MIMFFFLKRTVLKINQQSKDYFVDKLKAYDELINVREDKLRELNEKIDNRNNELNKKETVVTSNNSVYLYDMKNITYKDDDIFKKMKSVDQKFKFNHKKVIMDFLEKNFVSTDNHEYDNYVAIREKFTQDKIFNLLTKKENIQIEGVKEILGDKVSILDDFIAKNKKFNLKKFISYLDKIVDDLDPFVYIYVGNENENYDNLNEFIKTKVNDSIFKGFKIVYRGKLYDFSI